MSLFLLVAVLLLICLGILAPLIVPGVAVVLGAIALAKLLRHHHPHVPGHAR